MYEYYQLVLNILIVTKFVTSPITVYHHVVIFKKQKVKRYISKKFVHVFSI